MSKNIVICSDGTGNTAIKGRGTNVFKVFECVDLNGHRFDPNLVPQVAIYDDGVGTETFKPIKLLGGAAGYGLSRNVRQLYKELCRIYDPGDRIFLFGFSRGAFTVRSLAGLILKCGILRVREQPTSEALEQMVRRAYRTYRSCYRTMIMQWVRGEPHPSEIEKFRARHCYGNEKIAFMGVWDTVDAVGTPLYISEVINAFFYRYKFPNRRLSPAVEHAAHALALDDERQSFHPLLWDMNGVDPAASGQTIDQVWFAGAHSNVGGGYPKQGMSLVALDWMMHKAENAGLRFIPEDRAFYRDHGNVDDKLYDARAGLSSFYRWKLRHISRLCDDNAVAPIVHLSVLERIAHGTEDYQPGNLPLNADVVFTPYGHPERDAAVARRTREAERVLKNAHKEGHALLERVRTPMLLRRFAYYLYAVTTLVVLLGVAKPLDQSSYAHAGLLGDVGALVMQIISAPFAALQTIYSRIVQTPELLGILSTGYALGYLISLYAARSMSHVFSQFWFRQQQHLRDALKRARADAKEELAPNSKAA